MEILAPNTCSVCHQPIKPEYYFCPNCGNHLRLPPLDTGILGQIKLYVFSIILPMIAFLFVSKWQGNRYFKSDDPKAQKIGIAAWLLILASTLVTIWFAVVWTRSYIQETVNSINTDFSTYD